MTDPIAAVKDFFAGMDTTSLDDWMSARGLDINQVLRPPRSPLSTCRCQVLVNFAATEPYEVKITSIAPLPFEPAQVESYTLTCERGGSSPVAR